MKLYCVTDQFTQDNLATKIQFAAQRSENPLAFLRDVTSNFAKFLPALEQIQVDPSFQSSKIDQEEFLTLNGRPIENLER